MAHDLFPILNKVLVKREETLKVTQGGIIIPETVAKKSQVGYVVALGPDVSKKQIEVGDKVLFDRYTGTDIIVDGVEYSSMMFKDIMLVLKEKEEDAQDKGMGQTKE